jgi:hypothetical protein
MLQAACAGRRIAARGTFCFIGQSSAATWSARIFSTKLESSVGVTDGGESESATNGEFEKRRRGAVEGERLSHI